MANTNPVDESIPMDVSADMEIYSLADIQEQLNGLILRDIDTINDEEIRDIITQLEVYNKQPEEEEQYQNILHILQDIDNRRHGDVPMEVDVMPSEPLPFFRLGAIPITRQLPLFKPADIPPSVVPQVNPLEQVLNELIAIEQFIFHKSMEAFNISGNNVRALEQIMAEVQERYTRAIEIKNIFHNSGRLSQIEMNQVYNIMSNIKKNKINILTRILRAQNYPNELILAISNTQLEPVIGKYTNITGNLWEFISDIFIRNTIIQNKQTEANMLINTFNDSIFQKESQGQTVFRRGNTESVALGRYGVVINSINLKPGQEIVAEYAQFLTNRRHTPSINLQTALQEPADKERIVPGVKNLQSAGGLYFECRIVDLFQRNPHGPNNNFPAGPLLLSNIANPKPMKNIANVINGSHTLPNVTQVRGLHISIHGSPHQNQSHIRFTLGTRPDGTPNVINIKIYFRMFSGINENNENIDK